jgi:hypothetical protein
MADADLDFYITGVPEVLRKIVEHANVPMLGGMYLFKAPEPPSEGGFQLYAAASLGHLRASLPELCDECNTELFHELEEDFYKAEDIQAAVEGATPAGNWSEVFLKICDNECEFYFLGNAERAIKSGKPTALGVPVD